jgi:hypothetical protein
MAVPWLRQLVAGLSPRRSGFAPGSVHVLDKVALGQVPPMSYQVLRFFSVSIIPSWLSIFIYSGGWQYVHWWPQFRDTVSRHDMNCATYDDMNIMTAITQQTVDVFHCCRNNTTPVDSLQFSQTKEHTLHSSPGSTLILSCLGLVYSSCVLHVPLSFSLFNFIRPPTQNYHTSIDLYQSYFLYFILRRFLSN